jgi:uncharacterized membrane protein
MGCVYTLLGLVVLGFFVGPWVLAGLSYRRQRDVAGRLTALEQELAVVRRRLAAAPAPPVETPASPIAAPSPAEPPPAVVEPAPEAPPAAPPHAAPPPAALPPAARPPAPPPTAPKRPTIDWERWIGVRGAAVLGGVVLALAGILFVRYSIERGLISPALRVALGILAGIAAIAWSQRLRKRGYRINADALAGAGIVLLYAAIWAAHSLYSFIGALPAYGLMSLVTAACGLLSWRHASLLIAVLGLLGGFATPLLLTAESESPLGLFGYVLVLDVGLIALARRRGWSALALLALAGTVFYQALWMFTRMQAGGGVVALAILAIFAVVFGGAGLARLRASEGAPSRGWLLAEGAGLLAPFAFALYLASRADLGPRLYPLAALLLLLSLAAQWLERRRDTGDVLASAAAAGSLAVVLVWSWDVEWTPALVWELVAVGVVLAAAFQLFFELDARAGRPARLSTLVATAGFLGVLLLDALSSLESPWPWIAGWVALAALLARQSIDPGRAFTPLVGAIGLGVGVGAWFLVARREPGMPPAELYFGVALLLGAALHLLALRRGQAEPRRYADLGAAAYAALLLGALAIDADDPSIEGAIFLAVTLVLGLYAALASTRLGSGVAYLASAALLAITHSAWSDSEAARALAVPALVAFLASAAFFALWPSWAPRLGRSRAAWRGAALAGPFWFWAAGSLFERHFGDRALGLVPLAFGALTLAAAYAGRQVWTADDATTRTGHLAWFGAVVLGFAAVAVPLQLDREWITVGWALEGLAVTALWRRLDRPGLKYFGAALFTAVTVRLLVNPEVLRYHEPSGLPVLNWLAYTYLVPAACLLGASRLLAPLEAGRAREVEKPIYARDRPVLAGAAALAAILVVFAWINLTIVDAFSTGPTLAFSLDRLPARDVTLSLAWVVYAVTLLGIGMARDSGALRWLSLGFLVLSIAKVFLYDLGELRDLYRVASLVGLAMSLILVSLAYQRFVFRRRVENEPA